MRPCRSQSHGCHRRTTSGGRVRPCPHAGDRHTGPGFTDLVTDVLITVIRSRDLSGVATEWMEIEITPVDPRRDPSLAVVSAASFCGAGAEPVGLATGHTDDREFWLEFFHDLRSRGLRDVKVIVSPEFRGLAEAARAIFPTAGVIS